MCSPTLSAENSNTKTHLAEFWMLEPEIAFADLNTVLDVSEQMIKKAVNHLLVKSAEDIEFFAKWHDKGLPERMQRTAVRLDPV